MHILPPSNPKKVYNNAVYRFPVRLLFNSSQFPLFPYFSQLFLSIERIHANSPLKYQCLFTARICLATSCSTSCVGQLTDVVPFVARLLLAQWRGNYPEENLWGIHCASVCPNLQEGSEPPQPWEHLNSEIQVSRQAWNSMVEIAIGKCYFSSFGFLPSHK